MNKLNRTLTSAVIVLSTGMALNASAEQLSLEEYLAAVVTQQAKVVGTEVTSQLRDNIVHTITQFKQSEKVDYRYTVIAKNQTVKEKETEELDIKAE